jgi:hypothetical protein
MADLLKGVKQMGTMSNPTIVPQVRLFPGMTSYTADQVDQHELERLYVAPMKTVFSLNRVHTRILARVVFPYWEDYLGSLQHPYNDAEIRKLEFGWLDDFEPSPYCFRVAGVRMESYTSLDMFPEKILFRVELCHHGTLHKALIIHESRVRLCVTIRDDSCMYLDHL